jgi:glycine C-acetyltransferase
MMTEKVKKLYRDTLGEIREEGILKTERVIESPQGRIVRTADGRDVINLCSNNYLGLAADPEVIRAGTEAAEKRGFGLSSVRFICGTQDIHKELESRLSVFLGTEDTVLYSSCFDANAGLFETLLGTEDAVISDELNHASIIDGIRLCKAQKFRYKHSSMVELKAALRECRSARVRLIATDGVFSMDGDIADHPGIVSLAEKYEALVMTDDSHATGYIGPTGRGTEEYWGLKDKIDIVTTTFGKALGGASGGCVSGRREITDLLRQKSRPYLFSNTLAPGIAGATIKVLDILSRSSVPAGRVRDNADYFRAGIKKLGFSVPDGNTAIVPVMLFDEILAQKAATLLLEKGVYVVGFSYPVVPRGKARIRVQLSAAHTREDLDRALAAFAEVGKSLGILPGMMK